MSKLAAIARLVGKRSTRHLHHNAGHLIVGAIGGYKGFEAAKKDSGWKDLSPQKKASYRSRFGKDAQKVQKRSAIISNTLNSSRNYYYGSLFITGGIKSGVSQLAKTKLGQKAIRTKIGRKLVKTQPNTYLKVNATEASTIMKPKQHFIKKWTSKAKEGIKSFAKDAAVDVGIAVGPTALYEGVTSVQHRRQRRKSSYAPKRRFTSSYKKTRT
ncbi:MAG: hypothetical protein AABY07_10895 [Nanoarchaeota archaeon]